jgi:hypothetical protein
VACSTQGDQANLCHEDHEEDQYCQTRLCRSHQQGARDHGRNVVPPFLCWYAVLECRVIALRWALNQSCMCRVVCCACWCLYSRIAGLHHSFQTNERVYLIMDFVGGGSLFNYLSTSPKPFAQNVARFYAGEVALALEALHTNNIVYRYGVAATKKLLMRLVRYFCCASMRMAIPARMHSLRSSSSSSSSSSNVMPCVSPIVDTTRS